MRVAVRVWRGVRGLDTNWRCCGLLREALVLERGDVDLGRRGEDGQRSRQGEGFMLAEIDGKREGRLGRYQLLGPK